MVENKKTMYRAFERTDFSLKIDGSGDTQKIKRIFTCHIYQYNFQLRFSFAVI